MPAIMQYRSSAKAARNLVFVRHGATQPNLDGLRCGGDLDAPLTELGRRQASDAALRIRELRLPVGVIVTSALGRTRETAAIMSRLLNGIEVIVEPGFMERRLGGWNLQSVALTQAALSAGVTPPGGESNQEFLGRIENAMQVLLPQLARGPLLIGSKGVARALTELLGLPAQPTLINGQLAYFDMESFAVRNAEGCRA